MKFYHIYDKQEVDEWFTNSVKAVVFAKETVKDDNRQIWVDMVDIGKPDLETIRLCLTGKGYAVETKTFWTNIK